MKIDVKDFKNKNGTFHRWVADYFIYTALAEMSGPERIIFNEEMVEKYEPYQILSNMTEKKKDALLAKTQKSYRELDSLNSEPEKVGPDISTSIFEELLVASLKFYDDFE